MVLPDQYEYLIYTTIQGDTWDMISLDFYNDEYRTDILRQANPQLGEVVRFDEGLKVVIPLVAESTPEVLPPWKR